VKKCSENDSADGCTCPEDSGHPQLDNLVGELYLHKLLKCSIKHAKNAYEDFIMTWKPTELEAEVGK
jgi:hypothetical protein